MTRMQQFGHDVWALVQGYWGSEGRWAAWALLTAIIGLDLGYVYINVLLNNGTALVSSPVLDPITNAPCPRLANVAILVSNYYRIPIPVAAVDAQFNAALSGFDQTLRYVLQFVQVPAGSKLGYVDLYAASEGREGLVLIERRLGFTGPFDFEIHPTNLGHAVISQEFERVFNSLQ